MATARPFAYNPGTVIPGTEQLGNLSIGIPISGFTDNPQYWNGPDEELGYVIAKPISGNTQPTPLDITASVGFGRSPLKTEESFVEYTNTVFGQSFTTGTQSKEWLNNNGYWTSYDLINPTPTNTPSGTPTSTPTPTPTSTVLNIDVITNSSLDITLTNITVNGNIASVSGGVWPNTSGNGASLYVNIPSGTYDVVISYSAGVSGQHIEITSPLTGYECQNTGVGSGSLTFTGVGLSSSTPLTVQAADGTCV